MHTIITSMKDICNNAHRFHVGKMLLVELYGKKYYLIKKTKNTTNKQKELPCNSWKLDFISHPWLHHAYLPQSTSSRGSPPSWEDTYWISFTLCRVLGYTQRHNLIFLQDPQLPRNVVVNNYDPENHTDTTNSIPGMVSEWPFYLMYRYLNSHYFNSKNCFKSTDYT